jgi:hypothetical protein
MELDFHSLEIVINMDMPDKRPFFENKDPLLDKMPATFINHPLR